MIRVIEVTNLRSYYAIFFIIVFLIIFARNIIYTMKKCNLIKMEDDIEKQKKISNKCIGTLISSFLILELGKISLITFLSFSGGFIREPNYIDFVFEVMEYIVLISVVSLGINIELIIRMKISNKSMHIISIISIILVSVLVMILIFGLFRGDYYRTTYTIG